MLLTIKFLIFFRQNQLPKITYQLAFYRICQQILGSESNISLLVKYDHFCEICHFFDYINVVFISGKMERELGSKTCLVFIYFSKSFNCLLPIFFFGKIKYAFVRVDHQSLRPSFFSFFTYGQIFLSVLSRLAYLVSVRSQYLVEFLFRRLFRICASRNMFYVIIFAFC